ncbi:hypothetical protein KCMC57_up33760 [Kitasatospora sp. CMC57]|uniref:Integral membrane protein n=1 Tax=Kitasatospora sp. CMC57 TaxID=3231513 RepID=A0AB33JUV7_9ACTN
MDHNQPYASPVVPVHFTPDGHPYYAAPPAAAPLAVYQPGPVGQFAPAYPPQVLHTAVHHPVPYTAGAGRDPWPARLLCGGIGIGAAGVGTAFLLQAIAAATTGLGLITAALALGWLIKNQGGGGSSARGAVNVHVTTHNRNR